MHFSDADFSAAQGSGVFPRSGWAGWLGSVLLFLFVLQIHAAEKVLPPGDPVRPVDLKEARKLFIQGDYTNCAQMAGQAIRDHETEEEWRLLFLQSLMTLGRYTNALGVLTEALDRYPWSLRLRLAGRDVCFFNGRAEQAATMLGEVGSLASSRRWAYQDAPAWVALGRAALLLGIDPKVAMEQFFDRAKKSDPNYREAWLASGQVALDKGDYALAAKIFGAGLKKFSEDPDLHHGLARAFAPSDRRAMVESIESALQQNTNHVPSYLLLADHLIDSEEYATAAKTLDHALAVNPWQPEAWAYRAVLAHLRNEAVEESRCRDLALKYWTNNPNVDHLIGRKLSQKYRFAEGAACQRRALQFDGKFLPAKIELAEDLLRLGEEKEGWKLAEEVNDADGYDVTAFNLVALRDTIGKFTTLTNADFVVRMSAHEAKVYGHQVLDLLQRAKSNLCAKYGMNLERPTFVEIFPDQKDFGVRTFGMPHNPGFLGVCFGSVITANSPAAQAGHPANWQAVLWHEFCHVVTLQLTRNKMPRWLSEGISVYEELQANPTWGQRMTPRYREMVLGKDLTPVGELSAAFLTAKSDQHMQFAYYESALVVEFLVDRFGLESLKKILRDLGAGVEINVAIATNTAPLETIEKDFAAFARDRAKKLAPGLDWEKPKRADLEDPEWLAEHPTNFYTLTHQAEKLLRAKKWQEAKVPLEKLLQLYPANAEPGNAYSMLAEAHHGLGETNREREVLTKLAALDADALEVFQRLMELNRAEKNWPAVATNAQRFIAVNPLVPLPYRFLAEASEALGRGPAAIDAYRTLLTVDPPDPADTHFRLARLLHEARDPSAKRHVLQALEEAPRFRDALRLLREMEAKPAQNKKSPAVIYQ